MIIKRISHILFAMLGAISGLFILLVLVEPPPTNFNSQVFAKSRSESISQSNSEDSYDTYLPIALHPPGRLLGLVTENGVPTPGVTVTLHFCKNYLHAPGPPYDDYCVFEDLFYTETDEYGYYAFINMPTLVQTGQWNISQTYQLEWENTTRNPDRLSSWESRVINSYSYGDQVDSGSFDVGSIYINDPISGTVITDFPVTFSWNKRAGVSWDNYAFCLWGGEFYDPYPPLPDRLGCGEPLGKAESYIIEQPPAGLDYGFDYWWFVDVFDPSGGRGRSFVHHILFEEP